MSVALIFLALTASALAAPSPQQFARQLQQPRAPVPILTQSVLQNPDGSYTSSYTTGDGSAVSTQGFLKSTNDKTDVVVAQQGSYGYTSPEGQSVRVTYLADEYGTHIIDQQPPLVAPEQQRLF